MTGSTCSMRSGGAPCSEKWNTTNLCMYVCLLSAFICMVLGVHLGHRKYKITRFVRDDYMKFMTMCRMLVLCEIKFSSIQTIIHM